MPPTRRPFPRFIADASQESSPYGRWGERLLAEFARACEPLASEAGSGLDRESVRWFPDRSWGGRVYVPVTGSAAEAVAGEDGEETLAEFYGWVSFAPGDDDGGEPIDLRAKADFTDVTAADNPDWKIDLNDDVVGEWRTDGGRGGEVTLVWGLPLVRGAVAVTAELDGEPIDQAPVADGRFTLVAVDAVHGFGDDLFMTVKLWDRRVRQLASESLYADAEDAEPAGEGTSEA
ncbi:MAG: hypothetical protein ABWZ18_04670 [Solirubrobacterales bacterium]|jgi:hypothetical protein